MPLQKQPITINFAQGLDTKTDPFQVKMGKFLSLQNTIFNNGGLLQKRNGYDVLTTLPANGYDYLTTFNGNLTSIGSELSAYSEPTKQVVNKSAIQPVQINTLSVIKNNTNQSQVDAVVAPNGLLCAVYTDQLTSSLSTPVYRYVMSDSTSGQSVVAPTTIANCYTSPRVFITTIYFIIVYGLTTDSNKLYFIAIPIANPSMPNAPTIISSQPFAKSTHGLAFDGAVYNGTLFVAWNGSGSSGIKVARIDSNLSVSLTTNPDAAHLGDIVSVSTGTSGSNIIWISYYGYGANTAYTLTIDQNANVTLAATQILSALRISNLTSVVVTSSILQILYEAVYAYSYDSGIATNYVATKTITNSGTVGSQSVVLRSVGLASKAFTLNSTAYVLSVYNSPYQSTFFLSDISGNIMAKLAYQNAGGYLTAGLPTATVMGSQVQIPYLYKDLIQAANMNTNVPAGSQIAGIYTQTGINLASFTYSSSLLVSAEIGANLNLNSGFLLCYDGYSVTENNFFLYPDSIELTGSGTGGTMLAQQYFYQVTYEWSDNQGNLFRSSPSIPVSVTTTGTTSKVTIYGPTLRLSLKNANNPVKIVIYRWSTGQQIYFQVTSLSSPSLNDPTTDSWAFIDTSPDSAIIGNNIIYTNGGVLENVSPPGFDSVFLFDDRLWGITSEDKNLLWFSKQVIESTPVEMSNLLTQYVAPTIGAQGSTGNLTCGSAMDDKLILFKPSAIYYMNGTGPDNTGANNGYSPPSFITATVGCVNQKSIIFTPEGLMFEFDSAYGNQIWILGRNLSSTYIGAPVQQYTTASTVSSVVNIPGSNQVRFTLASGVTLMYDYYYGEWSTFSNIPALSSTLYQGVHTYINSSNQVLQETPGQYLDGNNPTLMSFKTSWISLAGIMGYQRAYFFYLLGTYLSPHKLNVQIAYDFNPSIIQQTIISPDNFSPNYGSGYSYGTQTPYGGVGNLEQWKIYLTQQRCQSFQLTISEIYDPIFNIPAGGGFTLSGINVVVGLKKGYKPTSFQHQAGGNS